MLKRLTVENYALIEKLEVSWDKGLTIITGETGAGKSILLGALSLILGQRADGQVLHDKNRKCFVEGEFDISTYGLEAFFEEHDLCGGTTAPSPGNQSPREIQGFHQRYAGESKRAERIGGSPYRYSFPTSVTGSLSSGVSDPRHRQFRRPAGFVPHVHTRLC